MTLRVSGIVLCRVNDTVLYSSNFVKMIDFVIYFIALLKKRTKDQIKTVFPYAHGHA